jgi:eukaryotic-like serine/threonine-protein kinase
MPCLLSQGSRTTVQLSDFRGRWLALLFYPRDFSMVCPTELTGTSARIKDFQGLDCELLAVSVDTLETHERWLATAQAEGGVRGLAYPLASDPKGEVSRRYGVYDEEKGVALRALFLIDPSGRLQAQTVLPHAVGRGTDETLRVLSALQTGSLCPLDWRAKGHTLSLEDQIRPGRVVSRYRIEAAIGAGAFATVFRARDLRLDRTVALKVFRPCARQTCTATLEEARIAASLSHPNVCSIYAIDDSEGVSLIAMEYLDGRALSCILKDRALGPADAGRVLRGVARGLSAAHEASVIHGDLKPGNIIVTASGVPKIVDFGLARRASPGELDPARESRTCGTPRYLSPERFRGQQATCASDVFAFGLIAYEVMTLRPAFPGTGVAEIVRQVAAVDGVKLAEELPPPFDDIVRRALEPHREKRTITMREIAATLGDAL